MATRELIDTATATVFSVSRYDDFNAAITAIGATDAYLLIDATTATNGNVTVPENVHTIFLEQSDITGTDTITWNGPVTTLEKDAVVEVAFAPDDITFPAIGKYIRLQRGQEADASEFGIRGVGDESTKIQNLMTAVGEFGAGSVYFPPVVGTYTCIDIQVPSRTTVRGVGYCDPFAGNDFVTTFTAASHSGTKEIFKVEGGGIDPETTNAVSVTFKGLRFVGPGNYNSQATRGIRFGNGYRHIVEQCTFAGFTRQGILEERSTSGIGFAANKYLHNIIFAAQAPVGALSGPIGALELHGGESWVIGNEVSAGHNQDYGATGGTNLYMVSFVVTYNQAWCYANAFDFGDIGVWCNATGTTFTDCRSVFVFGPAWQFQQWIETGSEGIGNNYTVLSCIGQGGEHATDTYDNFYVHTSVGYSTFRDCISKGTYHRYGFNDQGPAVSGVGGDSLNNRNLWINCSDKGSNTAWWNPRTSLVHGPALLEAPLATATDADKTPSVAQVGGLTFNYTSGATLTQLDDGVNSQEVLLINLNTSSAITIGHGGNFSNNDGSSVVLNASKRHARYKKFNDVWREM